MTWQSRLAEEGLRVTGQRRTVMQVLAEATEVLSPREIWALGRQRHHRLGLVTVYRTLALMASLNWVRRIHREGGCNGYQLCSPGHWHTLVCRRCGSVTEFVGTDDLGQLVGRVESQTGYRVDQHQLQLTGLCPRCREGPDPLSSAALPRRHNGD